MQERCERRLLADRRLDFVPSRHLADLGNDERFSGEAILALATASRECSSHGSVTLVGDSQLISVRPRVVIDAPLGHLVPTSEPAKTDKRAAGR
jgi:hypothetical protein